LCPPSTNPAALAPRLCGNSSTTAGTNSSPTTRENTANPSARSTPPPLAPSNLSSAAAISPPASRDPHLIGVITAKTFAARNLGSTEAKSDLVLPNEIEFSLSANVGLTFREDVEPRTRRIDLEFYEENPNGRNFRKPDLHGWVLDNRTRILGAVAALVQHWMSHGCPPGKTPFNSFPEWARTVGGIMTRCGLGDPCLPHESEPEIGGDRLERAMRAICRRESAWAAQGLEEFGYKGQGGAGYHLQRGAAGQNDAQDRTRRRGRFLHHHLGECRGARWQGIAGMAAFAQPCDEGLVRDPVLPGERHGAQTAAVEGFQ
jgi:hypothetical protein